MDDQMVDLVNRVTRSTVAVVDTVAGRGGFRGEELSTIGQLRDQCINLIQRVEALQGETNDESTAEED
tara:strand:+ start:1663 stop:1866 length:204 start_codon:yes stop_codon:yes gene_type:complete